MKKEKTKKMMPLSIDKKLADLLEQNISNKSKYVEYLIYQDLKKHYEEETKNIFI
jgi:ribosomal protein S3AE